jgi:pentapeptide MXKDX repeat protein
MYNQNNMNIIFSLILGTLISYYYQPVFNKEFIISVIIISIVFYIIFYYLNSDIEYFINEPMNDEMVNDEMINDKIVNDEMINDEMVNDEMINDEMVNDEMINDEMINDDISQQMNSTTSYQPLELDNQEETQVNMINEIIAQEDYIKDSIKKEIKKKNKKKNKKPIESESSDLENDNNINIFINNAPQESIGKESDKMNEQTYPTQYKKQQQKDTNQIESDTCSTNYFKNASRIYNNASWFNALNDYQHEKYNYEKLSPCSNGNNSENYLLPCIQPEANKIPQTLNNLMNKKQINKQNNVCPIEINQTWSNYKTGDDKQKDEILPEGYNI